LTIARLQGKHAVLLADSVTELSAGTACGRFVACGSHGGAYSAHFADFVGVGGIIFNDAGVGRDAAGIAALQVLERRGRPAGAVSHARARIGRAADTVDAKLAHVNGIGSRLGCTPGMSASDALARMLALTDQCQPPGTREPDGFRKVVRNHPVPVLVLDSASQVEAGDAGAIVITGSHGGLVGGQSTRALKTRALGAAFNDAAGGRDDAGWSRLPALDRDGIPAVTVSSSSARIGDGLSTLNDGIISHANATAQLLGVRCGMTTRDFIVRVAMQTTKGEGK
jgi:uncharacterized protein YunC (DUF1805 family)